MRYERQVERLARTIEPYLHDDFFFVNVGASDGVVDDPIHPLIRRHRWRGLAVEPVPHVFRNLRHNYRDLPGVTCVNAAVSDTQRAFYCVAEDSGSIEYVAAQIGSLDRERVLASIARLRTLEESIGRTPPVLDVGNEEAPPAHEGIAIRSDLEDHVQAIEVECVPFNDLMERYGVDHVDLLNIDAEGADLPIFLSIDLERFAPSVLVVEADGFDDETTQRFERRIGDAGYQFAHRFSLFSRVYELPARRRARVS